MEGRQIDTTITYKPNCYYDTSEHNQSIILPLGTPQITFNNLPNKIYFGEQINVNIFVSDINTNEAVGWGFVNFYYVDEDDITQTKVKINTEPIAIDKNGNAGVKYIPHNHGYFLAEYEGKPYYYSTSKTINFVLFERPTHIEFIKYAPYLVDDEEIVELSVKVIDNLTQEPLDYGWVTFLNYYDHNNGLEKVIGNPVCLNEEGIATITYSPIQLNTNQLFNNHFELIRAVYNYDNELYGVKWKYYQQHSDYTSVAIRRNNRLNISTPKKQEGQQRIPLSCDNTGLYTATSTDSLYFQCEATVVNTAVIQADVSFFVTGKQIIYNNGEETYVQFDREYKAQSIGNNQFECANIQLPFGKYRVYSTIDNVKTTINDETYDIPCDGSRPTNIIQNKDGTQQNILDGIYLQAAESESLYINIEPLSSDLELTLDFSLPILTDNVLNKNNLILTIGGNNVTNEDKSVLHNQKCYFWFSDLNTIHKGTLKYNNGTLQGKLDNNITISNVGDHTVYAYILGNVYSNGTYTRQYGTTYSNNITIKRRNTLSLNLRVNSNDNVYPGNIQYILSASNILSQDIINVNIKLYKNSTATLISTHDLTSINPQVIGTITGYDAGTYTLKAEITTPGYTHISSTVNNVIIQKADLEMTLNSASKVVKTAIQNDILIGVEHADKKEIGGIDVNKLQGKIRPKGSSEEYNTTISMQELSDTYYLVSNTASIFIHGDWEIKLNYQGDNNYNSTSNDWISFKAFNQTPECINIMYDTTPNDYIIRNKVAYWAMSGYQDNIINNDTIIEELGKYYSCDQYVLIINKLMFADNQNPFKKVVSITNLNGEYNIDYNYITNDEFSRTNIIQYDIDAQHTLLNAFKQASDRNNAVTKFRDTFPSNQYTIACTDNDIKILYDQAKTNHFTSLFIGYNKVNNGYLYL